jgi:hypothetical protein
MGSSRGESVFEGRKVRGRKEVIMAGKEKGSVKIEWDEGTEKKLETKFKEWSKCCGDKKNYSSGASGGAVYGFGLIGALVYFIGNASTFGEGIMGILKSLVWPALLVFQALKLLGL